MEVCDPPLATSLAMELKGVRGCHRPCPIELGRSTRVEIPWLLWLSLPGSRILLVENGAPFVSGGCLWCSTPLRRVWFFPFCSPTSMKLKTSKRVLPSLLVSRLNKGLSLRLFPDALCSSTFLISVVSAELFPLREWLPCSGKPKLNTDPQIQSGSVVLMQG